MKIQLWSILFMALGMLLVFAGLICLNFDGCAKIAGLILFIPFGTFTIFVSYKDRYKESSDI